MTDLVGRLRAARVVPVVRTSTAALAERAVEWLRAAGLRVFEITMTVPDAPALIRSLSAEPDLLIGAGTVADAEMARACLEAGARFIVAPWVDTTLAAPCRVHGAALMLGAMTPTEVRAAVAAGADAVKVFPASSAGGPGTSKRCGACCRRWRSVRPAGSGPGTSRRIWRRALRSWAWVARWWTSGGSRRVTAGRSRPWRRR